MARNGYNRHWERDILKDPSHTEDEVTSVHCPLHEIMFLEMLVSLFPLFVTRIEIFFLCPPHLDSVLFSTQTSTKSLNPSTWVTLPVSSSHQHRLSKVIPILLSSVTLSLIATIAWRTPWVGAPVSCAFQETGVVRSYQRILLYLIHCDRKGPKPGKAGGMAPSPPVMPHLQRITPFCDHIMKKLWAPWRAAPPSPLNGG